MVEQEGENVSYQRLRCAVVPLTGNEQCTKGRNWRSWCPPAGIIHEIKTVKCCVAPHWPIRRLGKDERLQNAELGVRQVLLTVFRRMPCRKLNSCL